MSRHSSQGHGARSPIVKSLDYSITDFSQNINICDHQKDNHQSEMSCKLWSVYLDQEIHGIKENSFNQHADVCLKEHWNHLIQDEPSLCQPFTKDKAGFADIRKSLIEWIFNCGDKLKQRSLTLQLAIVYLDKLFLLGKQATIREDKYLWGLTALLLASKYDEIDWNIPYIKDFRKVSSEARYSWDEVTQCESTIAEYLKWDLMIISPLNYTYALLTFGVIFSNDEFKYRKSLLKTIEQTHRECK